MIFQPYSIKLSNLKENLFHKSIIYQLKLIIILSKIYQIYQTYKVNKIQILVNLVMEPQVWIIRDIIRIQKIYHIKKCNGFKNRLKYQRR